MLKLIKVTFLMYDSCKDFKSDCVTVHRDPGPLSAERGSQCCSTIIFIVVQLHTYRWEERHPAAAAPVSLLTHFQTLTLAGISLTFRWAPVSW